MATRATSRGPVPADRRRAAPRPGADSGPALTFPLTSHGPVLPDRRAVVGARQLVRTMQAAAGNLAVTIALQRAGGWPDAASQGPAWNDARPKQIGRVRRLAIAGLAGGATSAFKGGDSEHTAEGADRRAIVLVPQGFSPKDPVDVLLYFHGHTEAWRGRYAGLRQRTFTPTPATRKAGLTSDNKVRDVDLDQIEQQMDSSGKRQTLGILAQGGSQHQFGDINVDAYISDVLTRTNKEYPTILTGVPKSWSVILSGHSGGGFAVQDALSAKNKPKNLKGLLLFDAEAMQRDMRQRITEDLDFLADPTHSDSDRDTHLAGRPSVRAFTSAGSPYAARYKDIVTSTIETTLKRVFPAGRKAELQRLRTRQAIQPLTAAESLRLKELVRRRPTDQTGRDELRSLRARQANQPLRPADNARLAVLAKQEAQLSTVTRYLPKIQKLYQLTALPPGVEHEEIIRGTATDSGDYQPGQGNLEKALNSLP
jgi:hypothetical protein